MSLVCPSCGAEVADKGKLFGCVKCRFAIWKDRSGHTLTEADAAALIAGDEVGPYKFVSRNNNKPFEGKLKLAGVGEDIKVEFVLEKDGAGRVEPTEFLEAGCPKCNGKMGVTAKGYFCQGCDFKVWKEVSRKEIPVEEIERLLRDGITSMIDGFVSKDQKPFSAMLKLDEGKVKFEFPPR